MKIIKETEVKVTKQDIEVKAGVYYFDSDNFFWCVEFSEDEEGWLDYKIEKFQHYSNSKMIKQEEDEDSKLPWNVEQLWKEGARQIEEKEYFEERKRLLDEINKD